MKRWISRALGLALALASVGCASPCERFVSYARVRDPGCSTCMDANCAAEVQAFAGGDATCQSQFMAAAACRTCGCYDTALPNATCRSVVDNWQMCMVNRCESSCR